PPDPAGARARPRARARPDAPEADGCTAMTWAVRNRHAATAGVLLEHGADPGVPGPDGVLPLVAAAAQGSEATVRVLLAHDAPGREAALTEARSWRGRDVAGELRTALVAAYERPPMTLTTVTRRENGEDGDDGATVVVEVFRDGVLTGGGERGTGHEAIAALLEGAVR
ncbi:ankyrin repeat domain-containing protein, partial [Streptomyces sp. NPDC058953]|uniref:ankyrin repeat domain-containing protein n=1 Tax=Streptomyces sp. NPDC058953 TaxID=3346676 RepID=UPI0036A6E001